MRRTPLVLGLVVSLAAGGYAAADAYDLVPGVLTVRPLPSGEASPSPSQTVSLPSPAAISPLASAEDAPVPTPAGLKAALAPVLADWRLGASVGVSVLDGITGRELYAVDQDTPRTPASLVKLLAAAAVVKQARPESAVSTRVTLDTTTRTLYLVAGGDALLAAGRGSPTSVVGRVGLADLAEDAAEAITQSGLDEVALRLDESFAVGETRPPGWEDGDYTSGSAVPVTMIGLAADRPEPGKTGVKDPAMRALTAFGEALAARGVGLSGAPKRATGAVGGQEVSVRPGASVTEVLAYALDESDNALIETVVRLTAYLSGRPTPTVLDAADYVTDVLTGLGVRTKGLALADTSGLTRGQRATTRSVAEVLRASVDGRLPGLHPLLAALPVSGLDGTLKKRFVGEDGKGVAGIPRAKTGTLLGTSNLAGWTVTTQGRPLFFVILADRIGGWEGTEPARAALDRFAATLTECGCR